MKGRRKLSPAGNGPVVVLLWWLWNVTLFGACIVATIYLARILVALLYLTLIKGVGAP